MYKVNNSTIVKTLAVLAFVACLSFLMPTQSTFATSSCGKITHFAIHNIDTGHPVPGYAGISQGEHIQINLADMPANFNIEAFGTYGVQSIKGILSGSSSRIENVAPYRFPKGDHGAWNPSVGEYTFTAKAYNKDRAKGTLCDTDRIKISVVGDAPATSVLTAPTSPTCNSGLLWENNIDLNDLRGASGIPQADVRFKSGGTTQFALPVLPAAFGSAVNVDISSAVAWDGYLNRPNVGDQPNERFKVVFLKDDAVVHETAWTGSAADDGIATGLASTEWMGSLGTAELADGADSIVLVHWADATYGEGDTSSYNSVVPSSVCIDYATPTPPVTSAD